MFILDILKSWCNFIIIPLLGKYNQQKRLAGSLELRFTGSRAHKARREFKGSALEPIFYVVLRLNWALIVLLNLHMKASCVKLLTFIREIKSYLSKVCIFLLTLFSKLIKTCILL